MDNLRSLLFVPGNQQKMLEKALAYSPCAFIPDMEDSVPESEKQSARAMVATYLPRLAGTGCLVIPRVNSLSSGLLEDDLAAVVGQYIDGVSVGKVNTVGDVQEISNTLDRLEESAGVARGSTRLVLWIESAQAIVHCFDICSASSRILAVAFGAEDYTADMEIERCEDDGEISFARNSLSVAARAAGVAALDTPFFAFKNDDALRCNALASKKIGFRGKFAIHPAQLEIIEGVFSPSTAELAMAAKVVEAFKESEERGRGSTSLDGKVIDVPVYKRALALLARTD